MNVQNVLAKALEGFLSFVQNAAQFAGDQVPQYIRELLGYFYFMHLLDAWFKVAWAFLILAVCFIASLVFIKKYWLPCKKLTKPNTQARADLWFWLAIWIFIVGILPIVAGVGSLMCEAMDDFKLAYKAKYAPRVYVIDYLKQNIK